MSYPDLVRNLVLARMLARLDDAAAGDSPWLAAVRSALGHPGGLTPEEAADWWAKQVADSTDDQGALGRLGSSSAELMVAAGLIESDIRFGSLFATLQEPLKARRPCIGLLSWLLSSPEVTPAELTAHCHDLVRRGLLSVENPQDPRSEWVLRVPVPLWDLIATGACDPASLPPQIALRGREEFPLLANVAVSDDVSSLVSRLPGLLNEGQLTAVVVRGMSGAGRTTLLGAVAASYGLDVLRFEGDTADPAWLLFGALASVADVLPVVRCEPGPGETVKLPSLPGPSRAIGIVTGRSGSVTGPQFDHALTIQLGNCGPDDRTLLWQSAGYTHDGDDLDEIVERFLLPPGNILRTAPLARLNARAAGRSRVTTDDVRTSTRTLRRQGIETLATCLDPLPAQAKPILTTSAGDELATLVRRCRQRERLIAATSGSHACLNRGVRALFTGPSGTGKTLAARHLAALLHLDLYRVDLAAVVNKYIGETERNLDKILARAEELDVLLLLDEGDALMTKRTDVSNANDRYANLETNFLLQRLETFDGIVVVTSNAAGRIDPAFLRRIDVTVDFVPPDAEQRWQIWSAHLPHDHEVEPELLIEVSRRCTLTGGQIRNAALHATLLAVDAVVPLGAEHLLEAVRREYRRSGAAYPMRELGATNVPSW